jgi:hypothetical protein
MDTKWTLSWHFSRWTGKIVTASVATVCGYDDSRIDGLMGPENLSFFSTPINPSIQPSINLSPNTIQN